MPYVYMCILLHIVRKRESIQFVVKETLFTALRVNRV